MTQQPRNNGQFMSVGNPVYCANCGHCKKVPGGLIRCAKELWRKRGGDEKFHKFDTCWRRKLDSCPEYEPMQEPFTARDANNLRLWIETGCGEKLPGLGGEAV